MAHTDISTAVDQFLCGLAGLASYAPMDNLLRKAFMAEEEIRKLFAANPHSQVLQNLFLGLVDVFSINPTLRRNRAREIINDGDLERNYIFPLDTQYRRPNLMPSTVPDINAFKENWELFTHGTLSKMTSCDWENVIVAGGSVLACLSPPQPAIPPKILNALFQSKIYATSDIDLFLWGLSPEEAKAKMERVYQAVCDAAPWNVTCVRKAHVISIHTTYPRRPIQIILRIYQSPAEILAGFDVDATCCAFDGKNVWVNPRSLGAIIRQANTVDIARQSPTYELRLAKYAERSYEIYLPSLNRPQVDPLVYAPGLQVWPQGLARLLVLERSFYDPHYYICLRYPVRQVMKKGPGSKSKIHSLRSSPNRGPPTNTSNHDYNLVQARIPYGPLWDAAEIATLISDADNSLNSRYEDHRQPHRHLFFAGDMQQCLESFCPVCIDHGTEDFDRDVYIRGPAQFMIRNPDRRLATAGFDPVEIKDWANWAYPQPKWW